MNGLHNVKICLNSLGIPALRLEMNGLRNVRVNSLGIPALPSVSRLREFESALIVEREIRLIFLFEAVTKTVMTKTMIMETTIAKMVVTKTKKAKKTL